jgi:hypothetical protein
LSVFDPTVAPVSARHWRGSMSTEPRRYTIYLVFSDWENLQDDGEFTRSLLYAGRSLNGGDRLRCHRRSSPWWGEAETIRVLHLPDEQTIRDVETWIIQHVRPVFNRLGGDGNAKRGSDWLRSSGAMSRIREWLWESRPADNIVRWKLADREFHLWDPTQRCWRLGGSEEPPPTLA